MTTYIVKISRPGIEWKILGSYGTVTWARKAALRMAREGFKTRVELSTGAFIAGYLPTRVL